jgi:predicted Zn-dependent protease
MRRRRIGAGLALALAAAPALAASDRYDTTAIRQAEILQSVGGPYVGPQSAYVAAVGEKVARAAGLPDRCVFTIVDSDVVNAFTAPPGCYVYVTRGLLAILNSEDELAAVLGHELGHVAANHSAKQQSTETVSELAAALIGAATRSRLAGKVAGKVAELGSLSYSRGQEYEADGLALHYLPQAGYAASGLTAVLDGLAREEAFSRGGRAGSDVPVWASTHPLTSDRLERARRQAALVAGQDGFALDSGSYLSALRGLPYGEAGPGSIAGETYTDPTLKVAFEIPRGASIARLGDAVRITGPGPLRAEFWGGAPLAGPLEDHAYAVMRGVVGDARVEFGQPRSFVVNGADATALSVHGAEQGRGVEVTVAAYRLDGRAYHFVLVAPAGQAALFEPMVTSFRRAGRAAPAGGGRRIEVVTVRPGDTVESLSARMAPDADPVGRFRMLNGLQPGAPLQPGHKVKLVVALR